MKTALQTLILMLICSSLAMAQNRPDPNVPQGENLEVPEGWEVRLDREMEEVLIGSNPDSADIYFVNMTPGWHISTGPAGIYYHPANTAEGNFEITSELHFFDPGERNREAYGIFLGGKNLDNENQSYLYFLLRNTGEYLIKERIGSETETLQGWTASDVINVYEDGMDDSSVRNVVRTVVSGSDITFHINGTEVASLPASSYDTDGMYGLRVNHSINLHVSDLTYTPSE
ncbi:hypothetical protein [Gracilimonas sp.]|uniref:hypothetical protein n=1 Tax=Gracilimonas sp. TaxID=1974203 RepID=UPI002872AA89|nr:hypothetical protein [Gracilimonas sp.]